MQLISKDFLTLARSVLLCWQWPLRIFEKKFGPGKFSKSRNQGAIVKKSLKVLALSAGLAACGLASQANAFVYADSRLLINQLNVTPALGPNLTVTNFTFTTTNSATLNGLSDFHTATCNGLPGAGGGAQNNCALGTPILNPGPSNAPGGSAGATRGNLDFSFKGPAGGFQFSNANSVIDTSELVNGAGTTAVRQIAESELQNGMTASANATIQSITAITLTFQFGGGALGLNFSANPDQFAQINELVNGVFNAQSTLSASFTLQQETGGNAFALWTPRGTAANDCISGGGAVCTETADSQNLNSTIGTSTNGTQQALSHDGDATFTMFGINITGLTSGRYSLTLGSSSQTQLSRQAIPEPGSLLLLGIGVAALGLRSRRQKKQAA